VSTEVVDALVAGKPCPACVRQYEENRIGGLSREVFTQGSLCSVIGCPCVCHAPYPFCHSPEKCIAAKRCLGDPNCCD
jgi:hypothetical protein